MGMAGGQETAGAAQMRPTASAAGHHLLRCKDSFPDGEAAGLRLEAPRPDAAKGGRIVSRHGGGAQQEDASSQMSVERRSGGGRSPAAELSGEGISTTIAGVGILALHALLPQSLRQLLAREAQHGGVQRQLERLTVRPGEGEGQPGPEGIQLPAEHSQTPAAEGQLLPEVVCQNRALAASSDCKMR